MLMCACSLTGSGGILATSFADLDLIQKKQINMDLQWVQVSKHMDKICHWLGSSPFRVHFALLEAIANAF